MSSKWGLRMGINWREWRRWDWLEWFTAGFFLFAAAVIVMLLVTMAIGMWNGEREAANCAKWEMRLVRQAAWTQYMWSGKVMVPIYHPARDVEWRVCVEPREQPVTNRRDLQ